MIFLSFLLQATGNSRHAPAGRATGKRSQERGKAVGEEESDQDSDEGTDPITSSYGSNIARELLQDLKTRLCLHLVLSGEICWTCTRLSPPAGRNSHIHTFHVCVLSNERKYFRCTVLSLSLFFVPSASVAVWWSASKALLALLSLLPSKSKLVSPVATQIKPSQTKPCHQPCCQLLFFTEITNASSSEDGDDEDEDESEGDGDGDDEDGSDESGEESEEFEDQGSDSDASEEMERQQAEAEVKQAVPTKAIVEGYDAMCPRLLF